MGRRAFLAHATRPPRSRSLSRRYAWTAMPDGGPLPELLLADDRAEELEREVLEAEALHVKVDECAELRGPAQDGAQPLLERPDRALSGSAGWTSGVRAETFTERLTRGRGPFGPRSLKQGPGDEARAPATVPRTSRFLCRKKSASAVLTTVSPRRSMVVAIPEAALLTEPLHQVARRRPRDKLAGHRGHVRLHRAGDERRERTRPRRGRSSWPG